MAQPTVTARPATWAGTSNPVLYKFTSTNYSNAGYRMEIEVWNNDTATIIATASYTSDLTGNLVIDISSYLKAGMSLINDSDLTTSDPSFEDTAYLSFYIKYQEVWTASSETQVSDSANVRYAVYGGRQIGSSNDFTAFVDEFLNDTTGKVFISGWPFTITAILNSGAKIGYTGGSNVDLSVASLGLYRIPIDTSGTDDIEITLLDSGNTPTSDPITITAVEECSNTIILQWRNSLGGDECFPFQVNQEYSLFLKDYKAKRLVLYADNLTLSQWETLNQLNTPGITYFNNIVELTTSVNRTSSTIGQSVYILNQDGTKIGVVVVPTKNRTRTKRNKHNFEVEIEYPEMFLQ